MNRLSTFTGLPLILAWSLSGPGCLPDDPAVKGRLLYPGIGIEHPEIVHVGGQVWVMFEIRQTRGALPAKGGSLATHLVNWEDPAQQRMVLASRAERPEWPRYADERGAWFYMTDERTPAQGLQLPVGTLLRVRLDTGVLESVEDVINYSAPQNERFYYRKHRSDSKQAELHLRDLDGRDRNLGLLSGQVQMMPGGNRMYFIGGEDQTMIRVDGFEGEPEKLSSHVSQFILGPGEKFALVRISDDKGPRTAILDLATKNLKVLPPGNLSWVELRGETFLFSIPADGGNPAELHYYDVNSGSEVVHVLPPGVVNVSSIALRPPHFRDGIVLDGRGGPITVYRPEAEPKFETTELRPVAPTFTREGRFLLYLEPEPLPPPPAISKFRTGKLFAQSAEDWGQAPRRLSPKGASVPIDQLGFRLRLDPEFPLVFWARVGLGGSDLYIASYETGATIKVAEGIGAVQIGDRHVLGVVRLSQDLTGDLVVRDFVDGQEQLIESGVADMTLVGDMVAFVVRERRVESRRNGLWATTLLPEEPGTEAPAPRVVNGVRTAFPWSAELTSVRPE
jgi:hypothetical protein